MRARPPASPLRHDDAGLTLVEMSVVMVVGALLLAALGTIVVGMTRAVKEVGVSTASVADARHAMEAVTRSLRVAYQPAAASAAVVSATPRDVSFYALLNRTGTASTGQPVPTLVRYAYDGRCLNETQTRAGVATTTCLMRTSVPPTFTYYPTPAVASGGVAVAPLPAVPGVASTDLSRIQSVELGVTVQDPSDPQARGVPEVVRVTLVNVVDAAGFSS